MHERNGYGKTPNFLSVQTPSTPGQLGLLVHKCTGAPLGALRPLLGPCTPVCSTSTADALDSTQVTSYTATCPGGSCSWALTLALSLPDQIRWSQHVFTCLIPPAQTWLQGTGAKALESREPDASQVESLGKETSATPMLVVLPEVTSDKGDQSPARSPAALSLLWNPRAALTSELTISSGTLCTIDTVAVDSGICCLPFLLCSLRKREGCKVAAFGCGPMQ